MAFTPYLNNIRTGDSVRLADNVYTDNGCIHKDSVVHVMAVKGRLVDVIDIESGETARDVPWHMLDAQKYDGESDMRWFSVKGGVYPECNMSPGALGVDVRVELEDGMRMNAYYGCRLTDKPAFYFAGALVEKVRYWRYTNE